MKKLLSFALAALMVLVCVFSFASCGGKGDTATTADGTSAATSAVAGSDGTLKIATSPDFPPFENLEDGKVVGIEVEIMEAVCARLGLTPVITQIDFDAVLLGVTAGRFDCGMSGITVTESRKENMLFTDPYCLAAQAIVVKEGSSITCKADLAGKKVSVQTGTTAEEFCMGNGYSVSAFQANSDAEMALVQGRVDAWVIDDLTAAEMVKEYNGSHSSKLVILSEAMTTEPYAFAFAYGNEAIVTQINASLQEMLSDGTIAALFAKYDAPYTAPAAK